VSRPASTPRLRRYAKAIASLAFLVLIAAACSSDGFPESYSDQVDETTGESNVEQNWREGCEVGFADSDLAGDANSVCACSFNAISGSDGIPFAEFVELDGSLKSDPQSLGNKEVLSPVETKVLDIVKGCIAGG